jgi:hypothetical protein
MKLSIRIIIGRVIVILGCFALAFAALLACLEWGGDQGTGGEFYFPFPALDRDIRITMAISASIGVVGVLVGMRVARVKKGLNVGPAPKRLP